MLFRSLRDRDGWKDTAQKIDGQWEKEKAILFQNFCTLYSNKHDHDETIITQLKAEIKVLKQTADAVVNRASTNDPKTKSADIPECLQDVPDDHRVVFDNDTVRRLARGERVPIISDTNGVDNDIPIPVPTSKSTLQRKRRQNPISGATEYMDPDDALRDILVPTTTTVPSQSKKTKKSRTLDDSNSVVPDLPRTKRSKPVKAASIKKEVPSSILPATTKTATKKSKTNRNKNDDDGNSDDTGSEDDFVDKSMEAQIMADLEALQKIS